MTGPVATVLEPPTFHLFRLGLVQTLVIKRGKRQMRLIFLLTVIFFGLITAAPSHSAPETIPEAQITSSDFVFNGQTNTFDTLVTVQNGSSASLEGLLQLILESASPVSISLYNQFGTTEDGKPYIEANPPNFVLSPGASISIPVRFINLANEEISASFSVRAERLNPDWMMQAWISLQAVFTPEDGGGPAGPGFLVKVDGSSRNFTNENGYARVPVHPGDVRIEVSYPPNYVGFADVTNLVAGEVRLLTVIISDSGEFGAESQLVIDRVNYSMLPNTTSSITARFFSNGHQVPAAIVEVVLRRDPFGDDYPTRLTDLFAIQPDGSIAASGAQFFQALAGLSGKHLLYVVMVETDGIPHVGEVPFYISQLTVQGRVSAPPSTPELSLGGIQIEMSVLSTDIKFKSLTATDGTFPIPLLPPGVLSLHAQTTAGDLGYIGSGIAVLNNNLQIDLKLRGPADIDNNVPPITWTAPLRLETFQRE